MIPIVRFRIVPAPLLLPPRHRQPVRQPPRHAHIVIRVQETNVQQFVHLFLGDFGFFIFPKEFVLRLLVDGPVAEVGVISGDFAVAVGLFELFRACTRERER